MATVIEIPGVGNVEFPDSMPPSEIDAAAAKLYQDSKGGADLTKTAEPTKAEPYDPSFGNVLSKEFFGGASDVATGVGNALSMPGPDKASQNALGVAQTGLGILRMLSAFPAASGSQLGESTGEGARQAAEWAGMGPTAQAVIGTAVGAPINVATQLILAPQIISKAIPVAMKAVQAGAKMLPGAQVALREIGKRAIARLPSILKPAKSADELFAELKAMENPSIALPEFQAAAKRILKTEQELAEFGLANAGLESATAKSIKATTEKITESGKWLGDEFGQIASYGDRKVPFDIIEKVRQRIGARIGELRLAGGEELGAYKQIFKYLSKDMESGGAKSAKFLAATKAANREFAIGELDDIFNATMGQAREGATFTSSNFAQALNKIRKLRRDDELFAKGLGNVHLDSIERRLEELVKIKVLPPPSGVNAGSMGVNLRMGAGTGVASIIGGALGGPQGAGIGASIGLTATSVGPLLISRIMQGPRALRALTDLLKKTGEVSPENFAALVALSKTEGIDDETGFRSIMRTAETDIKTKITAASERYNLQRERLTAEAILNR